MITSKSRRVYQIVSTYRSTVLLDLLTSFLKMTEIPPLNAANNK